MLLFLLQCLNYAAAYQVPGVSPEPATCCSRCRSSKRFSSLHAKAKDPAWPHGPPGALCGGCCRLPGLQLLGSVWDGSCDRGGARFSVSPRCAVLRAASVAPGSAVPALPGCEITAMGFETLGSGDPLTSIV